MLKVHYELQPILANVCQEKPNNWEKKSSKLPVMIIPYLINEGMQISKQKMKSCVI